MTLFLFFNIPLIVGSIAVFKMYLDLYQYGDKKDGTLTLKVHCLNPNHSSPTMYLESMFNGVPRQVRAPAAM